MTLPTPHTHYLPDVAKTGRGKGRGLDFFLEKKVGRRLNIHLFVVGLSQHAIVEYLNRSKLKE